MKIKTSDLSGAALDWAVGQVDDREIYDLSWRWVDGEMLGFGTIGSSPEFVCFRIGDPIMFGATPRYSPSTDWSQGGPLIESQRVDMTYTPGSDDDPEPFVVSIARNGHIHCGPTPLIAACRAIVSAKIGETVDVPDELL